MNSLDDLTVIAMAIGFAGMGMIFYAFTRERERGPSALVYIAWIAAGLLTLIVSGVLFTIFEFIDIVIGWLS